MSRDCTKKQPVTFLISLHFSDDKAVCEIKSAIHPGTSASTQWTSSARVCSEWTTVRCSRTRWSSGPANSSSSQGFKLCFHPQWVFEQWNVGFTFRPLSYWVFSLASLFPALRPVWKISFVASCKLYARFSIFIIIPALFIDVPLLPLIRDIRKIVQERKKRKVYFDIWTGLSLATFSGCRRTLEGWYYRDVSGRRIEWSRRWGKGEFLRQFHLTLSASGQEQAVYRWNRR